MINLFLNLFLLACLLGICILNYLIMRELNKLKYNLKEIDYVMDYLPKLPPPPPDNVPMSKGL